MFPEGRWFIMADTQDSGPQAGDKIHVTMEIGPPKYYGTVRLSARRSIDATDEHLDYSKGDYVDKVVLQGELEVTDVYRKDL
jgi:hypothetical protein